jgi:galactonate dehydratase
MRIIKLETFRVDGGWRPLSFLKIVTDEGLVGWSEFVEGPWSPALREIIAALGKRILGKDPRHFARLSAQLHAGAQFAAGGLNHQAVAAIENACLDIAAKWSGTPVYSLFGGPFRDEIDLYWSHLGTFRVSAPEIFERVCEKPRLRTLDDLRRLTQQVVASGYKAAKTNPIIFEPAGPRLLNPGFVARNLRFERTIDEATLGAIAEQGAVLREGMGADGALMIDFNFGFRPQALRRIIAAVESSRPAWLEMDLHDPAALAVLRSGTTTPIASLESLYGRREYKRYLEVNAVDVAIVDVPWNGFCEAVRIAAMAEAFEVNVAPHNFYGPLADLMSAHFCATVPNVPIMEIEGDDVPWKATLLSQAPEIKEGRFRIPSGPGWGADINEEALRAHPWMPDQS